MEHVPDTQKQLICLHNAAIAIEENGFDAAKEHLMRGGFDREGKVSGAQYASDIENLISEIRNDLGVTEVQISDVIQGMFEPNSDSTRLSEYRISRPESDS